MRAFFVSCVKCVCLLFSLGTFWFISAAEAQQSRSLITQAVDESRLTILKGNIHPQIGRAHV